MNSLYKLLALLLLAGSSLAACQEKVEIRPEVPIASAAVQMPSNLPPVLLQFAEYDADKDLLTGFLINQLGEVRTYSITDIPSEYHYYELRRMPDWVLEEVAAKSIKTDITIDLGELNNKYRIINRIREHSVTTRAADPSATSSRAFYAFTTLLEDGESAYGTSNCGNRDEHQRGEDSVDYLFVPLQSEGKKTVQHDQTATVEIVDWMISLLEKNQTL